MTQGKLTGCSSTRFARIARVGGLLAFAALFLLSCAGPPCRSQDECPFGSYCVLDGHGSGRFDGHCTEDCFSNADCAQPASNALRAVCTNEGRCRTESLPPKLRLLDPEVDATYLEGTRTIRVAGEIASAADVASISVVARNRSGCGATTSVPVNIENPESGSFSTVPFLVDGVLVDPGVTDVEVTATVRGAKSSRTVAIEVPCAGCATLDIDAPRQEESMPGLELELLSGTVDTDIGVATWRVFSPSGDVFDGPLAIDARRFSLERVPLFAGSNRVQVVVTGRGTGLGEMRCTRTVVSGIAREHGLRAIATWDAPTSDVDLHLVGPGGRFGDPGRTLSARSRNPTPFSGTIHDDFDGLGPEVIEVEDAPDGVYGLVVEAVDDGRDLGSNVDVWILYAGHMLKAGPIGPVHIGADLGDLWVVGVVAVSGGSAEFTLVDEVIRASLPPMETPDAWLDGVR